MTDYNEKINAIIEYFEENEETFNDCIEELDAYNGYLCDDRYYSMYDLDDLFCNEKPTDILNRAFFGYDEETWTRNERGEKTYGEFNPNRDFFRFNGYGNLVSADYKDYSAHLDKYAVEDMSAHREHIDTIENDDDLAALFDALENDDESEG